MVTLIIVPVFYTIFVLDLKIVGWEERPISPPPAVVSGDALLVAAEPIAKATSEDIG